MIYFIKRPDGCIKIGTTIRLSVRLKELQAQLRLPKPPDILGVRDGAIAEEHALQRKFRAHRLVGEWFKAHDELLEFIKSESTSWNGIDEVPQDDKKTLFAVKCVPGWRDWLMAYADFLGVSMTEAIDIALRGQSEIDGFCKSMPGRLNA